MQIDPNLTLLTQKNKYII